MLTSALIDSGDVEDTVGINVEGDLNLWHTSGSWWDSLKVEFSEDMVVLGHLSLSLEDLDENSWLVVSVGGEGLGLLGWDGGVSVDDVGHDSTGGLDSHGEWGDIKEKELLSLLVSLSGKDSSLNSSSVGNSLIWVDGLVEGLSVEELLKHLLDLWDSGGSSDENDLVDLSLSDTGVLEDVLNWWHALSEEINEKFLELGS